MIVVAGRLPGEPAKRSEAFEVRTPELSGTHAYWEALSAAWRTSATVVNVEHDMEFSDRLVAGLLACPHPLCTYAYRVYINHRRQWVFTPTVDGRWIDEGDEWASTASLGFVKVAPEARARELKRMPWQWLEHSMCYGTVARCAGRKSPAMAGWAPSETGPTGKFHVHWPEIEHYHDYDAEAIAEASEFERFCLEVGVDGPLVLPSERPLGNGVLLNA